MLRDEGIVGSGVDGCFGPATRAQLKQLYDIDVNALMASDFEGKTTWFTGGVEQPDQWPCHPSDWKVNQCTFCGHGRHEYQCSVFMGGENDASCDCAATMPPVPNDPCGYPVLRADGSRGGQAPSGDAETVTAVIAPPIGISCPLANPDGSHDDL